MITSNKSPNDLNALANRVASGQLTKEEIATLRQLLVNGNLNTLQLGKYPVNVGQGQNIQIGDRIYQGPDSETIERSLQQALRSLQNKQNSQSAGNGINALTELMLVPEVWNAAIAFRADFQAAREQVKVLGNYKDLHDLLHTLEFQCYSGIVQEAKRFPNDETALDILMDYKLTLQSIVDGIRDVAKRETFVSEIEWIKYLDQAEEEMQGALDKLDTRQLQKAIWLINRLLTIQPSRINTSLNQAARALRLPALVNAMICIRDKLAHMTLDLEKTSEFQNGVDALDNLNHNLTFLVKNHNDWQNVDLELRRIEANLEPDTSELEMSWSDLKTMIEPLYSSSIDDWAVGIKKDSENLDSAIANKNPAKIKRCFRSYRRQAGNRFYQIDVDLKRLCDDLLFIGEPLASVLRMME